MDFVESQRGQPMILYEGYKFTLKKVNKNNTKCWRCADRTCGGSVTTDSTNRVVSVHQHSCIPSVAKSEIMKSRFRCKKRSQEEYTPIPQIFEEEFSRVKDAGLDFVIDMPGYSSIKSSLYRQRHSALGVCSLPKRREDICLPPSITGEFLLIDDGMKDRILMFSSNSGRQCMNEDTEFFADGTFKSCCQQFSQLYSIHTDIANSPDELNVIPAIYALLPDKQQTTYERCFSLLKEKLPLWSPHVLKIDFEVAAIQGIRNVFPQIEVKGCNFHFNQSVWRRVQTLGLTTSYRDDADIRKHIHMCAALAHLPSWATEEGWLFIMESSPLSQGIEAFNDYFVDQWIENDIVNDMWICYGEKHRTTNVVEGWHNRLNRRVGKMRPNIFELMKVLKEDAQHYESVKLKAEYFVQPAKRRKRYANLDMRINKCVQNFVNGVYTVGQCLEKLKYIVKLD